MFPRSLVHWASSPLHPLADRADELVVVFVLTPVPVPVPVPEAALLDVAATVLEEVVVVAEELDEALDEEVVCPAAIMIKNDSPSAMKSLFICEGSFLNNLNYI